MSQTVSNSASKAGKPNQVNAQNQTLQTELLCTTDSQKKNVVALKKASASIKTIIKMIEEGANCYEILQQTRAVMGLLKGVQNRSVQCSIEEEFGDSDSFTEKDKMQKIQQIIRSVELFNK